MRNETGDRHQLSFLKGPCPTDWQNSEKESQHLKDQTVCNENSKHWERHYIQWRQHQEGRQQQRQNKVEQQQQQQREQQQPQQQEGKRMQEETGGVAE
ncbi:hypothetical protein EPH_0029480 [Eimeria praecox]|uniref:Uncharacterized protein n=1 Tax=Eimeria praecox TaxID=51316 RepID=U6G3L6_9EIME|nr:hypothetical protein EPH_0029480 [Eimeria praecox]